MRFDDSVCGDLALASGREWIEANGIGGFASSTIAGMNTRRYHGLLVAATRPPVGRMVLLSKMEETLIVDGRRCELSTNRYPGAVHPSGYTRQTSFALDPFPVMTFQFEGVRLEKEILMIHGENSTLISYRLSENAGRDVRLELRPLIAFRDYHSLTRANPELNPEVRAGEDWSAVEPYAGLPALYLHHPGAERLPGLGWHFRFQYERERDRGLDSEEDLFNPFGLKFRRLGAVAFLLAGTEMHDAGGLEELRNREIVRRRSIAAGGDADGGLAGALVRAADAFLVGRGEGRRTVIAGYPWFTDWGRDAMIALPGLTIATGRFEDARQILLAFAERCDRGMLPNRFPDEGEEPEYNTADASLWFLQAVHALTRATGDLEFVRRELYGAIREILRWHEEGTRFRIRAEADGLLHAGEAGLQLTWMDAKVGDRVVTPRTGKPVEIQALWYNALRVAERLAHRFGDDANARRWGLLASRAHASFNSVFWNEDASCLFDCVGESGPDASIRPNQILAVSLPFSMLSPDRARSVVEVVRRELLTPRGLRSLSPRDPAYCGRYSGDVLQRDSAYHQGTAWPWLLGPYITARLRVGENGEAAREEAEELLGGFEEHLGEAGIGTISEIFDGDPPHEPRGCIAQAWSVAEILRALREVRGDIDPGNGLPALTSEGSLG